MEQLTVDVSSWMVEDEEWLGEQPKLWLSEPNWGPAPQRWLFKPARRGWLPQRGTGNLLVFHWQDAQSEVIASQLARTIGLPAAHVVPARRSEERGCISLDVCATGEAMHSGDTYLSGLALPGYVPNRERPRNRTGHHLDAIGRVLEGLPGPRCAGPALATEIFAGYLVLDAWIANTDRHAENWALTDDGTTKRLAASFDHGSSLGAGLDERGIGSVDPIVFARGGMAQKFDGGRDETLVALANRALRLWGGPWLDRLEMVDANHERSIVERAPGMSDARRTFVGHLLAENRRRLIES